MLLPGLFGCRPKQIQAKSRLEEMNNLKTVHRVGSLPGAIPASPERSSRRLRSTSLVSSSRFAASAGRTGLWRPSRRGFDHIARSTALNGQILCNHSLVVQGKPVEAAVTFQGGRSGPQIRNFNRGADVARATQTLLPTKASAFAGAAAAQGFLFLLPFDGTGGVCALDRLRFTPLLDFLCAQAQIFEVSLTPEWLLEPVEELGR
jgi:hypothetical protein